MNAYGHARRQMWGQTCILLCKVADSVLSKVGRKLEWACWGVQGGGRGAHGHERKRCAAGVSARERDPPSRRRAPDPCKQARRRGAAIPWASSRVLLTESVTVPIRGQRRRAQPVGDGLGASNLL